MPTTSEMLLHHDRTRARSQQREIGWSEIGGCRRRAGYRLAGTPPSNPSGSVQAVMGTAIDDAINTIARLTGLAHQQSVVFAGIGGHFDRIEDGEVVDTKTVGTDRWLEHIELHGPSRANQWQVQGYCAGLLMAGEKVNRVRIDFLARDTGREYQWRAPFDPEQVRAALEWVRNVREAPLDMLPRDYEPDTVFCQGCPFRDVCWEGAVPDRDLRSVIHAEDPNTGKWADRLFEVRAQIKALRAEEDRLKGILDAVRPDDLSVLIAAGARLLEFRETAWGYGIYFRAASAVEKGRKR